MTTPKDLNKIAADTLRRLRAVSGKAGLGYNRPSVIWVDDFIEKQRKSGLAPQTVDGLIDNLGCYLGRCIIETYGGKWAELEGGWAIQFDLKNAVFPFNKIAKQFQNGSEDSILSMFELIPAVFPGVANFPGKPWWKFW